MFNVWFLFVVAFGSRSTLDGSLRRLAVIIVQCWEILCLQERRIVECVPLPKILRRMLCYDMRVYILLLRLLVGCNGFGIVIFPRKGLTLYLNFSASTIV